MDNFAEVHVSVVDCPDLTKEPFTFPVKGKQSLQLAFPFQTKSFPETKIIFKDYLKLSLDKGYCPNFQIKLCVISVFSNIGQISFYTFVGKYGVLCTSVTFIGYIIAIQQASI